MSLDYPDTLYSYCTYLAYMCDTGDDFIDACRKTSYRVQFIVKTDQNKLYVMHVATNKEGYPNQYYLELSHFSGEKYVEADDDLIGACNKLLTLVSEHAQQSVRKYLFDYDTFIENEVILLSVTRNIHEERKILNKIRKEQDIKKEKQYERSNKQELEKRLVQVTPIDQLPDNTTDGSGSVDQRPFAETAGTDRKDETNNSIKDIDDLTNPNDLESSTKQNTLQFRSILKTTLRHFENALDILIK